MPLGARGTSSTNTTRFGALYPASCALTPAMIDGSSSTAPISVDTTALTAWPKRSSSTPTTRQSITPGTRLTASSTSSGKIFSPPELITLLPRPMRISVPSAPTLAMSPGNE